MNESESSIQEQAVNESPRGDLTAGQPVATLPSPYKVILSPTEFAALFGRHFTWAYRQIYAGKIHVIHDLGRIMIPRSEVDRLLQTKERYNGTRKTAAARS